MEIPNSMVDELAAWNNGDGISLEGWIGCEGNFRLAVGYMSLFWPEFVAFEDYILAKGFDEKTLRGFESRAGATAKSVEWVMNHIHLDSIQHLGCPDLSSDKLLFLGDRLKEIYQAKLHWQFPERPCVVEFYKPDDPENLVDYQISFWQKKHEERAE